VDNLIERDFSGLSKKVIKTNTQSIRRPVISRRSLKKIIGESIMNKHFFRCMGKNRSEKDASNIRENFK
jgi:serine kinase of HPr protein (carbohydrate metabolism regulator)